jgi:hypothetical protein
MRSKNPAGHVAGLTGSSTIASPWRRMETVSPWRWNSSGNFTSCEPLARTISATFMAFPIQNGTTSHQRSYQRQVSSLKKSRLAASVAVVKMRTEQRKLEVMQSRGSAARQSDGKQRVH